MALNHKLTQLLFGTRLGEVYAVLDGASVPGLLPRLEEAKAEALCLFRGELEPDLAAAAPYVVHLPPDSLLTAWVLSEGWGQHWGIYAVAATDPSSLRRHFRHLLQVQSPDGKRLFFRFYDPRVLRTFLPTCDPGQLTAMFGPLRCYIAEDRDATTALSFTCSGQKLQRRETLVGVATGPA